MKRLLSAALILVAAAAAHAETPTKKKAMPYPNTKIQDVKDVLFGVTVPDPYRWLEDAGKPEVKAWMDAEDKLARDALSKLDGRDRLTARLKQLYYVDSISAPMHRGSRFFYTRRHADKEKAIVYWREGEDGDEKLLLDPNTMSQDGSTSLGPWVPSWDGKQVAYGLKANNSDEEVIHVMEVSTGKVSTVDVIEGVKWSAASWTPKGDGFYYTYVPLAGGAVKEAERTGWAEIRFHRLGTNPRVDAVVREKTGDPELFINADMSRDGHWLFLNVQHGWNSTDLYYRDMRSAKAEWKPLIVGQPALYEIEAWKDRFYIRTNDGAPRFRLFRADPKNLSRKAWKEIVPETKDAVLEMASLVGGHLALAYTRNAMSELEVRTLDGKPVRKVALPGLGAASSMMGEPDDEDAYYAYASFTQPWQIYKTSVKSGATKLWAEIKLPIDPAPYTVEQVWYPSKDGTKVSMFIVRKKEFSKDGSTPFLLTGYGGFSVSELPAFQSTIFPWLEAGGGFAVPNLRGGGEYGEEWHKAGMQANKQNVFDDFAAAAQYLIDSGYTKPDKLAIRGGSNGGLLMGAAVTQHPELFRAVICQVPLLDMVRYHLFGTGKIWIPEYGSAESEAGFKWLHAYSPYHHVRAGTRYPALLMMSADSDDRVDPMHARKMTAALQAAQAGEHPILLRIEKHAGHGGADLVKQAVEQSADSYAFLMHELGMRPADSK